MRHSAPSTSSTEPKPLLREGRTGRPQLRHRFGDIAAAKASDKVWVNLGTGIYHKGGRWYGKTKDGKFMTEDEAKKAGYKPPSGISMA